MNEELKKLEINYPSFFTRSSDQKSEGCQSQILQAEEKMKVILPADLKYFLIHFIPKIEYDTCLVRCSEILSLNESWKNEKGLNKNSLILTQYDDFINFYDLEKKEFYSIFIGGVPQKIQGDFYEYFLQPVELEITERLEEVYGIPTELGEKKIKQSDLKQIKEKIFSFEEFLNLILLGNNIDKTYLLKDDYRKLFTFFRKNAKDEDELFELYKKYFEISIKYNPIILNVL